MLKKSILLAALLTTGFAFGGGCTQIWSGQGLGLVSVGALLYQAFGPAINIPLST
jgi:hypothetical protein